MRRHAHRQRHGALGATCLARLDGTLDGRCGAGNHHLARRIEVDRADHLTLRRFGTGGTHGIVVQTKDRRHTALPGRHCLLHQLTTQLDQLDRIGKRQTAGRDQRRVLAQAVTGNEGRLRATLGLPQTPQRHRRSQDGRLGLVGLVKKLGRTFLGQRPEVVA
ncbi:hypothetical protein D3C86_1687030 [compost metagenome]